MNIKKVAVRGGHNFSVTGAKGIIDETVEDRKVKDAVIKYFKLYGIEVLDVTAPNSYNTIGSDLAYGVNKANEWGADLFISCHFNNCYPSYSSAIGTEVWTYKDKYDEAVRVVNNLANAGFINRGVKHSQSLYELKHTNCKSMIVETCFVESVKDVELYNRLGYDYIGKLIVAGILNKKVNDPVPNKKVAPKKITVAPNKKLAPSIRKKQTWERCISGEVVKELQKEIDNQFNKGLKIDGYFGDDTLKACPVVKQGAKGNITKIIQKRLIVKNYVSINNHGGIDGIFGEATTKAIKELQKNKGLVVDGIVGKDTWLALFLK